MQQMTTANGLSNKQTFSVVCDKTGFIWVSTRNGVDRFNGSHFKTYRLVNNRGNDLAGRTNTVILTPDTLPCVYTNNGDIFRYDTHRDSFLLLASLQETLHSTDLYINNVSFASDSTLFVCHSAGLLKYNITTGTIDTIHLFDGKSINSILPISNTENVVTTGNGFYICNINSTADTVPHKFLDGQRVQAAYFDQLSDRLFLGTFSGNLLSFDLPTRHLDTITETHACVRHITLYDRALWLATDGQGVVRVELDQPRTKFFSKLQTQLPDCPKYAYHLLIAKNRLWVATHSSGLCCFNAELPAFDSYSSPFSGLGKTDNALNTVLEDHNGALWIAGNQGICRIDQTGKRQFILKNGTDNNIMALCEDRYGNIWAGGSDKTTCIAIDETTCKIKHQLTFPSDKPKARTYALFSDSEGRIWTGGYGSLLTTFNPTDGIYKQYPIKYVNHITEKDGIIYVGTTNGLMAHNGRDNDNDSFTDMFDSLHLSSNLKCINHIQPASDGSLWLSTEGGLIHFDVQHRSFSVYSTDIGLLSNSIYAALPDDRGNLWISCNRGLQRFSPTTNQIATFTSTEGLPDENFKNRFSLRLHSGILLFGTASCIVAFDPELITHATPSTRIVINTISRNGETDTAIVADNIENITVTANDKQPIACSLTCINYALPDKTLLRWKLKDYDSEWIIGGENNVAIYSHIPQGIYTLEIQAVNKQNGDVLAHREITIEAVTPFFRRTSTLVILSLIVLISIIILCLAARKHIQQSPVITNNITSQTNVNTISDNENTKHSTIAPAYTTTGIPIDNEFIEKVSLLLDTNMDNSEYTIDKLAADMAMSRSSFFTKLKAISGLGPNEFIRTYRMQHAAQMIREHKYSITEVAYASGFSDVKYFSTVFKKHFGVSPSKFK